MLTARRIDRAPMMTQIVCRLTAGAITIGGDGDSDRLAGARDDRDDRVFAVGRVRGRDGAGWAMKPRGFLWHLGHRLIEYAERRDVVIGDALLDTMRAEWLPDRGMTIERLSDTDVIKFRITTVGRSVTVIV